MKKLFLASKSPRRNEILKKAQINFSVIESDYDERLDNHIFSYEKIENLAKNKALGAIAHAENGYIISADTVVVLQDEILTKPKDREDAFNMINKLSNVIHKVVTSICVIDVETGKFIIQSTTTKVEFNKLTEEMINLYIDNFKPFDKAGAYGIQELPDGYVKAVEGDLENVIGISSKSVLECISKLDTILEV